MFPRNGKYCIHGSITRTGPLDLSRTISSASLTSSSEIGRDSVRWKGFQRVIPSGILKEKAESEAEVK